MRASRVLGIVSSAFCITKILLYIWEERMNDPEF
jgi:hypothetical protein